MNVDYKIIKAAPEVYNGYTITFTGFVPSQKLALAIGYLEASRQWQGGSATHREPITFTREEQKDAEGHVFSHLYYKLNFCRAELIHRIGGIR